jgi:hypothetical protein
MSGNKLGTCRQCRYFRNEAAYLETILAGLSSLSSAYGSVRCDDGVCLRHDRLIGARASCPDFFPAADRGTVPAR